MEGFIVRVTVHHGEPVLVGNLYHRSGNSSDELVPEPSIINDFDRQETIIDLRAAGRSSSYTVTDLISDFENEHDCKVGFGDDMDTERDGVRVHEFDVFEPSWSSQEEAQAIMEDLTRRLVDWAQGYPAGR